MRTQCPAPAPRRASCRRPDRRSTSRRPSSSSARRRRSATTVQTLTVDATGGTFVLHFLRPERRRHARGRRHRRRSPWTHADAGSTLAWPAISAACLNPNNASTRLLPHTDNVRVTKHGNVFLLAFQGEDRFRVDRLRRRERASPARSQLATRVDGINYYGVETLEHRRSAPATTSSTSRARRAVTNLSLGAGDDRVYVSSQAAYGLADRPDFLRGDLDALAGALNLDLGTGRHTLMISDEAAAVGDTRPRSPTPRRRTLNGLVGRRRDLDHRPRRAGRHHLPRRRRGNFADGITYWTGSGADTITIDGTHLRAGVRTVTTPQHRPRQRRRHRRPRRRRGRLLRARHAGPGAHLLPLAAACRAGDHHDAGRRVDVTGRRRCAGAVLGRTTRSARSSCSTSLPIGAIVTVAIQRYDDRARSRSARRVRSRSRRRSAPATWSSQS